MHWRKHKGKLGVGAGVCVLFLVTVLMTPVYLSSPAVALTFLYTTNHPHAGRLGVFQVVNQCSETIINSGGHYKPATRSGFNVEEGDYGANSRGSDRFAAGTTNVVMLWIPTNGGPYRLVFRFTPVSKTTPAFYSSARVRFFSFISPFVKPSFATQARWYGAIYVESQSFEAPP
jgi:hypothetical protein